ncbi:MAG TPA: DNA-binding domain-containing protein [Candidatus Binatia bacterium]|nr:DNA-binding domain-containing protein [Candidatus Binatia bacterium]
MPPLALRELQERFWDALARAPGAFAPETVAPALLAAIEPSPTLDPAGRLAIYADAYFWRIREALREDYPCVAAVLGDAAFDGLVRAYLARHPSAHPSLRHVGERLAEFVAARWAGAAPPFLADLARLEWARVEVFDAPDAEPLSAATLRRVAPEAWARLRFAPVPACEVVTAAWPVHALWAGARDVGPAPTVVRVWRQGWAVYHAPMDAPEAAAFARVRAGAPFGAVCEIFADRPPESAAAEAGALLARWLADELLVLAP